MEELLFSGSGSPNSIMSSSHFGNDFTKRRHLPRGGSAHSLWVLPEEKRY